LCLQAAGEDGALIGTVVGEPFRFEQGLAQSHEQSEEDGLDLTAELKYDASEKVTVLVTQCDSTVNPNPNALQAYPLAIHLEKETGGDAENFASQSTFAEIGFDGDSTFSVKPHKQKIQLGEDSYELQEIYGIELHEKAGMPVDEENGEGVECVICMTDARDTTVLPCRHMCLCANCAKILRYQTNKCPVCREEVSSLLQIKVQSTDNPNPPSAQ